MLCVGQDTPIAEAEDFLLDNKLCKLCSVLLVHLWYSIGVPQSGLRFSVNRAQASYSGE